MESNRIVMTEPCYPLNEKNTNSLAIKKSQKALVLPLIKNISNLFDQQNNSKISKTKRKSVKNKSSNKKRISTARSPNKKRYVISKDLDLVYKLNMEIDVDQLFEENIKLKKEREKIDQNPEIKSKRMNKYKNVSEKKDEKKIEIDSKEKEKYLEKQFRDELENLEKIKKECSEINMEINEIRQNIDEYKMELNIFANYGDLIDKNLIQEYKEKEKNRMEKQIMEQVNEENNENSNEENNNNNSSNNNNKKHMKSEKFGHLNAYLQMKILKEEKQKKIKKNLESKEEELKELEEKQNILIQQCKERKSSLYKFRHQLLNIYHINLYEGLNFRSDGLATLIRSIWNLGVNVDVNYMPSYLDNDAIDYLFDKTKRIIEISKFRKIIEENKKELEETIQIWKLKMNTENTKDSSDKTDSNFFTTGVMAKYNYLDKYPKSKQFMEEYNKKYFPKRDKFEINVKKKNEFKSKNIPYVIIEKYHNIEKLKFVLQKLLEKNDNKEKKEIERLCKEFICNNYGEKYNVSIETVLGALCGEEKKNEGLNLFTKYQREYKEGKKLIQFHTNINRVLLNNK